MKNLNFTAGKEGLDFLSSVEAMIKRSCIIDFGIIQKVSAKGIVEVSVAVSKTPQDMVCMTCVLANTAGASCTIDIIPEVGDRVLVVYPRIYDEDMFTVSESGETDIKVNPEAKGYNLTSGIAILLNQYKTAGHKNTITVDKGKFTAKLAWNGSKNLVEVSNTADGDITVKNDKATVSIDKDGNVVIDTKGKYTIKNSSTDLFQIIKGLIEKVNALGIVGSVTGGSSVSGSIDPASQTVNTTWVSTTVASLLEDTTPPEPSEPPEETSQT